VKVRPLGYVIVIEHALNLQNSTYAVFHTCEPEKGVRDIYSPSAPRCTYLQNPLTSKQSKPNLPAHSFAPFFLILSFS
jgi:hypothetical protein